VRSGGNLKNDPPTMKSEIAREASSAGPLAEQALVGAKPRIPAVA
jgi:hypothetical protein